MSFEQQIRDSIFGALAEFSPSGLRHEEIQIEHPVVEEHGDYATNIALTVWRGPASVPGMTRYATPLELAEAIATRLRNNETIKQFSNRIEVVPPGFINFWISPDVLLREMMKAASLRDPAIGGAKQSNLKEIATPAARDDGTPYGKSNLFDGQTVVVDYSGPNIAKSFGIGHLRSTIIGQAIYNLYKFLGARVIGDNHLGDWGRQFGVLLAMIAHGGVISPTFVISTTEGRRDLSSQTPRDDNKAARNDTILESLTIENLEKMYVEFHKEAEENPALWDEARSWFKKLEDNDPRAREIWQKVKDISLTEFNRIYDILGVAIDYVYGESYYEKQMPEVVEECKKKGIAKESEGALIVEFPSVDSGQVLPPAILVKSDGATNYFTRDLATIKFRLKEWSPSLIVYEVGAEQALHFQQLFKTVELLGWTEKTRFVHIKHGLYLAPSGKKFSTRKGDTVHLEDVLNEAIERARRFSVISNEASSKTGEVRDPGISHSARNDNNLPCDDVSVAVGVGAVKYFDLSHHPSSNIVFDWDKIMALEGNSAPYLQYTYARCKSVLAKMTNGQWPMKNLAFSIGNLAFNDEELAVLRSFYKFPEVAEEAATSFSPNLICNFLFDLAQKYNTFYNMHRILPVQVEAQRYNAHRILPSDVTQEGSPVINGISPSRQARGRNDSVVQFRLALTAAVGNILKTGLSLLGIETPEKM